VKKEGKKIRIKFSYRRKKKERIKGSAWGALLSIVGSIEGKFGHLKVVPNFA
jgi:hypothetical protein